jgi:hypothetical protein
MRAATSEFGTSRHFALRSNWSHLEEADHHRAGFISTRLAKRAIIPERASWDREPARKAPPVPDPLSHERGGVGGRLRGKPRRRKPRGLAGDGLT